MLAPEDKVTGLPLAEPLPYMKIGTKQIKKIHGMKTARKTHGDRRGEEEQSARGGGGGVKEKNKCV